MSALRTLLIAGRVEVAFRLRQRVPYLIVVGLAALSWFSVQLGARELTARRASYAAQLADLAHEQVRPRLGLIGSVVEPVLRSIRPPEVGSVIARGEDVTVSAYFDFGPAGTVWGRTVAADVTQMRSGTLPDLESLVRVLGGFLALVVGFQSVADAKVRGSLRAWDALGADVVPVVLGRVLGCWALVTVAGFVIVTTGALAAIANLPDDRTDVARLFGRCLLPTAIYLGCFVATGASFAIWSRNQAAALAGGIALWIIAAMVWPEVVALGARLRSPGVHRVTMEARRDQAYADELRAGEDALGDAVAGWVGDPSPDVAATAVQDHWTELDAIWREYARNARATADAIEGAWQEDQLREARFERWSHLSPGTPLLRAISTLAGTGPDLARRWPITINQHQRRLMNVLFDDRSQIAVRVPSAKSRQILRMVRHPAKKWQDLPAFQPPSTSPAELWRSAVEPLAALTVFLIIAGTSAAVGARRYLR